MLLDRHDHFNVKGGCGIKPGLVYYGDFCSVAPSFIFGLNRIPQVDFPCCFTFIKGETEISSEKFVSDPVLRSEGQLASVRVLG